MKATGIVRRIDDLGRVVIPKEIRRTMRIREGDPLEIYTNSEGEVIFKKYSAIGEMSENASHMAEVMYRTAGCPVVITDKDHVTAVSGVPRRELNERRVSPELEELMEERGHFYLDAGHESHFHAAEGSDRTAIAAVPIITAGDVSGAVVFLSSEKCPHAGELQKSLINASAQFLARQIEG
ncbi:MAG: AbrB/MazE/SpoVT family DNA-binding domain-containing protein [Ruminococcus sp.]|nr:AbrB/MazE/SpoVT family DNA-binding domain-containing protein [Ruminococcus sp.]